MARKTQNESTAPQYDVSAVAVAEPPAQSRPRESSIPADVLSAMADKIGPDAWVTNGATYATKEDAQNDAGKFKRSLFRMVDGLKSEKGLKSRTWVNESGKFVFALTIRPPKSDA